MTKPANEREAFARLGELVREAVAAPVAPALDSAGRRRLSHLTEEMELGHGFGRRQWLGLGLLAFGGLAAAAVVLVLRWQVQPLTYEVFGGTRFAANYVAAHPDAPAKVAFSDGTQIDAEPGARLRIDQLRSHGARVFVERGRADARVTHRERSQWTFVAGPFDVRVIGTKFKLDWDPVQQTIQLDLLEGAVEIASPVGQSHCIVRAGQRFRASLPSGTMTLESISGPHAEPRARAERAAEPVAAELVIASAQPVATPHARASRTSTRGAERAQKSARPPVPPGQWMSLVRRGAFQDVVDAALAGDIETTLATCSVREARALADAARYLNQTELAQRSLLAIRDRFGNSRHSSAAGFLMGRTSETSGQLEQADSWYRRYADEAPVGEFAADALAGRMRCAAALAGPAEARPYAHEYLRRFPQGVHLEAALRLSGQR